jgi:uncharacterized protein YjiS (DUF1127 family)
MTTIRTTGEFAPAGVERWHVAAFLRWCRGAVQKRRKRARLRAVLHAMPDRLLRDIGIWRSEIEYFALNGSDEGFDARKRP